MIKQHIIDVIATNMASDVFCKKIEKLQNELESRLYEFLWDRVPEEIKATRGTDKEGYIKLQYTVCVETPSNYTDITINKGYPGRFRACINEDWAAESATEIRRLQMEEESFCRKLGSSLCSVLNPEELKERFPEAYEVYLLIKDRYKETEECSSVEDVRNEWKLNKGI